MKDVIKTWPCRIQAVGLNYTSFAKAAGGYVGQLWNIIHGKTDPSTRVFHRYEDKLKELECTTKTDG